MSKIYFLSGLGQGGAERQVVQIADLLNNTENIIKIITYDTSKAFYNSATNVDIIDLKPSKNTFFPKVTAFFNMRKIIKKEKPEFVISYVTKLNLFLGFVAISILNKHTIFIGSERNSRLYYDEKLLWRVMTRIGYKGLDGLITNNYLAIEKIYKNIPSFKLRTLYMPNYINLDTFNSNDVQKKYSLRNKVINIMVPGRVTNQKNQLTLVPIAKLLKKEKIQFNFNLVGSIDDKKYVDSLVEYIDYNECTSEFTISGVVKEMSNTYNNSDIIMLPSLYEGFPNVILEAMSCGKLCIVSNKIDSLKNIIVNSENGFFINFDNKIEVVDLIKSLIQKDDHFWKKISANSVAAVKKLTGNSYYNIFMSSIVKIKDIKNEK